MALNLDPTFEVAKLFSRSRAESWADPEDPPLVVEAKKPITIRTFTYERSDVARYNRSIGATELKYAFESDKDLTALPSFGIIPGLVPLDYDFLPNYSQKQCLHGELYLKLLAPLPVAGTMTSEVRIAEILDKSTATAVTTVGITKNDTGSKVAEVHSTFFVRGVGGFGGRRTGIDRGAATALNPLPLRPPDKIVEERTSDEQEALYLQSRDLFALTFDRVYLNKGNVPTPIMHGNCFFGIAARHIVQAFGPISDIKVRFVGSLFPGETLVTQQWKEGSKIIFTSLCKERGTGSFGCLCSYAEMKPDKFNLVYQ